ncbi:MAG: cache domain-containing protein [Halothece sp.]
MILLAKVIPLNSQNQEQAKPRKVPLYLAFAVPFTLQVLGIVGLVGYLSYRSGQQTVQDLTNQLLVKTENRVVQRLDDYFNLPHEINQFNIAMVESGVVDLENLDQLHHYLITEHQKFPQLTSIHFGNPKGEFLVVHRVSALQNYPQELRVEVGRYDPDHPSWLNLYALDQEGKMGRYLKTLKNIDVRERPWYRRAVTTQTSGWSELFQIGNTNLLAINAYAPFYNASQELEGVFSINLSLEVLSDFLANLIVNHGGETFIWSSEKTPNIIFDWLGR